MEKWAKREAATHGCEEMMRAAADALRESSGAIADAMAEKARAGDVRCANFLLALAGQAMELSALKNKAPKRSLATEWANEPEWTDEDAAREAEGQGQEQTA
jgi:hypothetical protein